MPWDGSGAFPLGGSFALHGLWGVLLLVFLIACLDLISPPRGPLAIIIKDTFDIDLDLRLSP